MKKLLFFFFISLGCYAQNSIQHKVILVISSQAKMQISKPAEIYPESGLVESNVQVAANQKWTLQVEKRTDYEKDGQSIFSTSFDKSRLKFSDSTPPSNYFNLSLATPLIDRTDLSNRNLHLVYTLSAI